GRAAGAVPARCLLKNRRPTSAPSDAHLARYRSGPPPAPRPPEPVVRAARIAAPTVRATAAAPLPRSRPLRSAAVTGVGLDLLEIDRLERALARRPRLAERLFTDAERSFAAARGQPARHLAVRFCAKEAVAKALQLRVWDWRDVEVCGGGDEPPSVRLAGAAAAR